MQRAVYAREHRGYWSAALPCVLQKRGIPVTVAGPEALADPAVLAAHATVLIARQQPGVWSPELVERVVALPGGAVVEGPAPAVVAERLGVLDTGAAEPTGAFQVTSAELREAGSSYGAVPGGSFGLGTSRPVELDRGQRWPVTLVPLSEEQATAWRARGWDARRWSLTDPEAGVLADWIAASLGRERTPGIVQRGGLIGCSAGIFAFLGQSHTVEPYNGGEHRNWPRSDSLEALLLGLIDMLHARAGAVRRRLLPWPRGFSWSMHVRHDVDRPLRAADAATVAARHGESGTRATWYWRARHLSVRDGQPAAGSDGNAALKAVASADGHEVALHTEALWREAGADRERAKVEAVLGAPIHGSSAHGDPKCFRFQGAPNVLWAEQQGLAYTELISHPHSLPHRVALLGGDGEITLTTVLCLPHHASFDRSMNAGDVLADEVALEAERLRRAGGLLQILNHPDINLDELFALLAELPIEGRWDATAFEAARWCSAAHALRFEARGDGTLAAFAAREVADLQVEARAADGALSVSTLSLPAGGTSVLG
jgi:hypothetical protein